MSATLYCGDARAILAGLPERSVQTCITSPPYWGLRDYGTASWEGGADDCDHTSTRRAHGEHEKQATQKGSSRDPVRPDCRRCGARRVDSQLGLERTPEEYVANMVAVFRDVRRVLRDDGTLWLNLGDSYAGSWGNQGRKEERGTQRPINGGMLTPVHDGRFPSLASNTGKIPEGSGLKPKDLVGIPWRAAFALQADGWYLRSDIIWAKPNPMPESVTDRPTKAHEYLFLLTKSERYYYDSAAIAEPASENVPWSASSNHGDKAALIRDDGNTTRALGVAAAERGGTRNARTVWTIATQPYSGAHFATFPEELARRCILAGSAAKACETCGAPWERVTELDNTRRISDRRSEGRDGYGRRDGYTPAPPSDQIGIRTTVGWQSTCICDNTGTASSAVLDPFTGSGTVCAVAIGHGRRAIGVDLNPEYLELARHRIGPMFCVIAEPPFFSPRVSAGV